MRPPTLYGEDSSLSKAPSDSEQRRTRATGRSGTRAAIGNRTIASAPIGIWSYVRRFHSQRSDACQSVASDQHRTTSRQSRFSADLRRRRRRHQRRAGWGMGYTGRASPCAVFDSGTQLIHPDLAANINSTWRSTLLIPTAWRPGFSIRYNAHGTAVAGLIAAVANNGIGGAGVAPGATHRPHSHHRRGSDAVVHRRLSPRDSRHRHYQQQLGAAPRTLAADRRSEFCSPCGIQSSLDVAGWA